jgi:hypothetical protein
MPATYEKIATTTLGSASASINFNSIGSSFTDLRLVLIGKPTTNNASFLFRLNSDSSSLYSYTEIYGDGSSAASYRETNINTGKICHAVSSTYPSMGTLDLFSYAGSTFKTNLATDSSDRNGAGGTVRRIVNLYRSTTAISSITLLLDSGDFASGTTATLYGILKA